MNATRLAASVDPGIATGQEQGRAPAAMAGPRSNLPPRRAPHHAGRGNRRAFTIFEVGMAAAVMAFAITSSITVMQRAFLALDSARSISYAAQIMQNELEKMRLLKWDTVGAYSSASTDVPIPDTFAKTSIGTRFTGMTRTAEPIHTGTNAGMVKITLTVSWRSYDGRSLSRSLITYYGQNGLYDYFSS